MVVSRIGGQAEIELVPTGRLVFIHRADFLDDLGVEDGRREGTLVGRPGKICTLE